MLRRIACVLGLALLASTAVAAPAQAASTCPEVSTFSNDKPKGRVSADMDGAHVKTDQGGDPNGDGSIVLTFERQYKNEQGEQVADVSYVLETTEVETPLTGAHIKKKPTNEDFMITVITFFTFDEDGQRIDEVTISKCLAHNIFNHPEEYYADVHNHTYDGGAIRGPLVQATG